MANSTIKTKTVGQLKRDFAKGKFIALKSNIYGARVIDDILNCAKIPTFLAKSDTQGVLTLCSHEDIITVLLETDFTILPLNLCNRLLDMEVTFAVINPSCTDSEIASLKRLFS